MEKMTFSDYKQAEAFMIKNKLKTCNIHGNILHLKEAENRIKEIKAKQLKELK